MKASYAFATLGDSGWMCGIFESSLNRFPISSTACTSPVPGTSAGCGESAMERVKFPPPGALAFRVHSPRLNFAKTKNKLRNLGHSAFEEAQQDPPSPEPVAAQCIWGSIPANSPKRMKRGGTLILSGICLLLSSLTRRSASFVMRPLGEGKVGKPSDRFIKVMRDVYGDWSATRSTPDWRPTPLPYGEAGELLLSDKTIQRRYLWTDAFGVLNFVSFARMTYGEERENALNAGVQQSWCMLNTPLLLDTSA
jgi:hypothetical protein